MKKHEIRVTIDSTEKQHKAIEILNRYKQEILQSDNAMVFDKKWKHLVYAEINNSWYIASDTFKHFTEITLKQLETILKNESK
jgi:hypothetical protein